MKGMPYRTVQEVLAAYNRQEISEREKVHYINQIKSRESRVMQKEIKYAGRFGRNLDARRKVI